jgi:hypothetical protein
MMLSSNLLERTIMSLEQFSYLAQIVAAMAVVASLLYVARQLGQNIAFMRVGASAERVQRDFDLAQSLIENREVAEFWIRGESEFEDLDAADKVRLMFFERRAIVHWHNMFELHHEQLLPESDWRELQWLIQHLGRRQAIRVTWQYFRGAFEESFQAFMDNHLRVGEAAKPNSEQPRGAV